MFLRRGAGYDDLFDDLTEARFCAECLGQREDVLSVSEMDALTQMVPRQEVPVLAYECAGSAMWSMIRSQTSTGSRGNEGPGEEPLDVVAAVLYP